MQGVSWLWGMVNIRKVSCSCGHVFTVTKRSKHRLKYGKEWYQKQAMSSFRAIERDERAADRRSVDRSCKAKKER